MDTASEKLLDASIRHHVFLQRYSTATARKIVALLNKADEDLVAKIQKYDPTAVTGEFSRKRLEKMLEAIRAINRDAYAQVKGTLNAELKDFAAYEAGFQARMIENAVPIALDIVQPSAAQLYAAVNARPFQGRLLKEYFSGLEAAVQARLRDAIRLGFVEGETIDQMVRRVRGTRANRFKDGILETNRRGAEAVVRTAVNHTATVARNEVYKANESVIKGVRWVATLDSRTTLICASRDGKVYPVDSGPRPPAHWNCRSTTTPVLKSWKEMGINLREAPEGTRASLDGQVPASTTYGEWLRKQPKSVQEDVLGVTKAKLYRDGKLPIDRFVDRKGEELTLAELARKESDAFQRAGVEL
ncbi:phage head morphogenesis protein [Rhodobium gokarnense]|uniref:SPP1 gp7 family putative phage head morphogenesis protein n=1 Tax=Rhodobium gokarnense TaxID=364296 RepID=A0ABT3HH44_9HYPH|nr:minor capsid protein [Rhodobium gokarnense]MCW2309711.1 SPP1 gp7 family putative phage head morphogenesis protein [Rhodobium gokarnense]